jgi:hypothetical protein
LWHRSGEALAKDPREFQKANKTAQADHQIAEARGTQMPRPQDDKSRQVFGSDLMQAKPLLTESPPEETAGTHLSTVASLIRKSADPAHVPVIG